MALLPPDKLTERARKECADRMKLLLTAPVSLTPQSESCEWNPILQRNLFSKAFVAWRSFDAIEMTITDDGRVVAFRDKRRAEPKNPPDLVPLTRKEVLQIAATSGYVGPDATVGRLGPGLKNMFVATVTQSGKGFPACVEYTINPSERHLVAFRVIKF